MAADMKASNVPFGFRTVPLDRKQAMVDDVFHRVASRYDLMNDLMSGGLHRAWKDAMVSWLAPPRGRPGYRALDVAGGTGDVGFRVAARTGGSAAVAVLDINEAMLAVGRERAARRADAENVGFVLANAEALPFASGSQSAYLIAFGIRNVARREAALAEAARVLRPGGRFLCLEFSQVDLPYVQRVYDFYSFEVIPRLGRLVAGDDEPYRYLVESIRTFPNPARFAAEIELAGLSRVTHRSYSGGIAAIHSAFKL
jgi:demethylmenaquinone methyltransferase/2-methoxy-6-polyprenyl-1,4-benzoquinol methylase